MMKRVCLGLMLSLTVFAAAAQKADSLVKTKGVKAKIVNGAVMASDKNIIQNVSLVKDYSVLLGAIKAAGLTETFESKGPITIFAPTNNAFAKMSPNRLDSLLKPENKYQLNSLITYHAIAGKVGVKDIAKNIKDHKGTAIYTTLAGSKLAATIDANRNIFLTDENGGTCVITQFDVEQSNGMLHVVDSVLVQKAKAI
jgi:uncharacterized surface protein with fasciclin (FAS1) repeats